MRPWEYFNEFVGGSANAYKYFRDEGVDLGQRSKEFAAYYKREVKPNGPRPVCLYWIWDEEKVARGIDCLGSDEKRDSALIELPERSGTIFAGPSDLIHSSYWDTAALRETKPVKRFGNLFIFSGTFYLPGQAASELYWRGIREIYGTKPTDEEAEEAFHRSAELDPTAYFVHIQLGNLYSEEPISREVRARIFGSTQVRARRPRDSLCTSESDSACISRGFSGGQSTTRPSHGMTTQKNPMASAIMSGSRANRKSTVAIRPLHSLRISGLARAWSTSVAAAREAISSTGNSATALFICSVGLLRFSAMFERERDLVAPRSGIMLCRFLHSHNDGAMPQSGLATDSFPQGNAP